MSAYNYTLIDAYQSRFGWDESQLIDISIVQRCMGTISLIGSSYVIQEVLRNEQKREHTFHRLMVGLSLSDILSSFFVHILSTAPMPKGYHILAIGNVATCDLQGFITTLCVHVSTLYNCSLATYYLVQLKYNWINRRIKALEKWLHVVPWSVGLVIATHRLAVKLYGPFGFNCISTPGYPIDCILPDSSVECIRGEPSTYKYILASFVGLQLIAIAYISVTMTMVYKGVSKIEKDARKYSFARYSARFQDNDRMRSRRVMLQGVLYSLALILTYMFNLVFVFTQGKSYIICILQYTFWPLQGFFNALIYSIPIFNRINRRYRDKKKERRNAILESQARNDDNLILSKMIYKHTKKQGTLSCNFESDIQISTSNNIKSSNIEDKDTSILHNNQYNKSVLMIHDTIGEEEGRNKELGKEEECKEEIQRSSKTSSIHSGLIRSDQFQLKRNAKSNSIDNIECNSDDHHDGNDICDGVEMEGGEAQGKKSILPHRSVINGNYESEDNGEGGVINVADDSNHNDDDVDDYLVLSSRR